MSKEVLLIVLLKSEQSRAELYNKVEEIKAEENRIKKTKNILIDMTPIIMG